jgi:hypothetical protein
MLYIVHILIDLKETRVALHKHETQVLRGTR